MSAGLWATRPSVTGGVAHDVGEAGDVDGGGGEGVGDVSVSWFVMIVASSWKNGRFKSLGERFGVACDTGFTSVSGLLSGAG